MKDAEEKIGIIINLNDYEFLLNLGKELLEQNRYSTAKPVYFQVVNKNNSLKNIFLTEKACREHIESNKHNYTSGHDFACKYANRNEELKKLTEFAENLYISYSSLK